MQWDNDFTKVLAKYINDANIVSFNLTIELPENTGINKYTIELVEGKQPSYRLIYILSLIELKALKAYIKTHQKTGFI